MANYISKIALPNGSEYLIKDAEARAAIAELVVAGLKFVIATDAATTPAGVTWDNNGTIVVGTLQPSADTRADICLVPHVKDSQGNVDYYREYVTVQTAGGETSSSDDDTYIWEFLGTTDIDLSGLGDLAWHDTVTLNKGTADTVLGASTTITASTSAVSFASHTAASFVQSYPGVSSKLETASIKGVGADVTFTSITSSTDYTATDTVFGTDTSASKIETEVKEATKTVFTTSVSASHVDGNSTKTFAIAAGSATNVSYIGNSGTSSILGGASVAGETLTLATVGVAQSSVTGTNGTGTVVDYTFENVSVPQVASNETVSVASVKTNTAITVPVVSSNTQRTMSKVVTKSTTAATSAANATTVATGGLKADDTVGATIMTGLGTATTASALTALGAATAAAPTINVGTNDQVSVATYSALSVTVGDNA